MIHVNFINLYIQTTFLLQVDCIDLTDPMVKELTELERVGMVTFDSFLSQDVLIVAPILGVTCDNPRASEVINNLGPGAKKFCRICMVCA